MGLPVIETERLLIRDVRESDTEAFFGYMQYENYWYYVPIGARHGSVRHPAAVD
jgi:hypothetical protein